MMSTAEPTRGPLLIPPWVLDLARGLISIGLGLGLLLWRSQTLTVVVWILVLNVLMDGVFDILSYFRGRRKEDIGLTHLIIGVLSCLAAGVILVSPSTALTFFLYYIAVRAGIHGLVDLWELVTSFRQREASLLLLVRGVLWLLVSAALLVAPQVALSAAIDLFAVFFLVDGLGSLASALVKSGRIAPRRKVPHEGHDEPSAMTKPPRAVVFVRRSGAKGLGHVGWAFEWGTGWFNTGSVENGSNAAFAPPDKMDFWTTHTLHPVATMQEIPAGYDEFKVFHVTDPDPRQAWQTVVWLSRQGYSVVRRNCSDCAYDVLRSYGVADLVDTAQENVPNRWYDALPGRSYRVLAGVEIPLNPERASRLAQLPVAEVKLHIPAQVQAAAPPWRARGGRAWYEARQRVHRLTVRTRGYAQAAIGHGRQPKKSTNVPTGHGTPSHL